MIKFAVLRINRKNNLKKEKSRVRETRDETIVRSGKRRQGQLQIQDTAFLLW